jgi:putative redox protein
MPTQRYEFENKSGEALAGRLELPDDEPRAFAVFAHCFTCTSQVKAATQISRALGARGIAALRFDFTGLGGSEGDFANTNFSSNVADLVAAARSLAETHAAPRLLVGHSLGGAAVLMAAESLPDVAAVATIGAPSDPAHVTRLLTGQLSDLEERGEAEVEIAGRRFTIKKQFVDDLRSQSLADRLEKLGRPLLIYHAPTDSVVGIENARSLFEAAKHPKSFISLDDADHLVSRPEDSQFVADTLAAWAGRYIGAAAADGEGGSAAGDDEGSGRGVLVRDTGRKYAQEIRARRHRLVADEPESIGGQDTGATPYDLLLAGLGSCTSITLRMYADRKGWALERSEIELWHERVHADDCGGCEDPKTKIEQVQRRIRLVGDLDDKQRQRLLEIADKCPVHKTLESEVRVVTTEAETG